MRRIMITLFTALATAGLVALGAVPAGAAVIPQVHVVGNGEAGYSAAFGNSFANEGSTVITDPAALNIGGVGEGGIGQQMCDPNNGFGLQLGLTSNGSAFTVEYATGILPSANVYNCEGNGLLTGPVVLHLALTGIAVGDHVQLFTKFRNYRSSVWHKGHWSSCTIGGKNHVVIRHCIWHPGHFTHPWAGRATFQAFDLTSGFDVFTANVKTAADWNIDEAGFGIEQDTTGMSACTPVAGFGVAVPTAPVSPTSGITPTGYSLPAVGHNPASSGACNDVADFTQVFTDGFGLGLPGFGLAFAPATSQVVTTGGALAANAAIVAPNYTLAPGAGPASSSFSVYAGQVKV
jgi:hypothetical protein